MKKRSTDIFDFVGQFVKRDLPVLRLVVPHDHCFRAVSEPDLLWRLQRQGNRMQTPEGSKLLTRVEAARFLTDRGFRIAPTTMAKNAVAGTGCAYRILKGRALYESSDLLAWAEKRAGGHFAIRPNASHMTSTEFDE